MAEEEENVSDEHVNIIFEAMSCGAEEMNAVATANAGLKATFAA